MFSLTLAHAGLACKVVLASTVPRDSTRALDFIIEVKPRPQLSVGMVKHAGALLRMITFYLTTLSSQMSINIFILLSD